MNDSELLKFVMDFRDGIIGGGSPEKKCFMVCAPLESLLNHDGIKVSLSEGDVEMNNDAWTEGLDVFHHYWLTLPDGRIIDPTASQFKTPDGQPMPDIYIGAKPDWYKEGSGTESE